MSNNFTTIKCKSIRYYWVDNLKLFACLLVVLGHLYMSMMAGGWISQNNVLYCWPIQTVYTFHVPLFFVCSGFLYQVTAKDVFKSSGDEIVDKLGALYKDGRE